MVFDKKTSLFFYRVDHGTIGGGDHWVFGDIGDGGGDGDSGDGDDGGDGDSGDGDGGGDGDSGNGDGGDCDSNGGSCGRNGSGWPTYNSGGGNPLRKTQNIFIIIVETTATTMIWVNFRPIS